MDAKNSRAMVRKLINCKSKNITFIVCLIKPSQKDDENCIETTYVTFYLLSIVKCVMYINRKERKLAFYNRNVL